jgi:O-antigen ligase
MVSLASLWLPILLSAVFAFLLSWVIHMFLPYHRGDVTGVPQEDQVMAALRGFNIPPGDYMIPHAGTPAGMKSPEFQEKLAKGPIAVVTVIPSGPLSMGKSLVQWFVYCLVVSIFAAYVASRAVDPGDQYLAVFRFAGVTAFAGYGLALLQNSIWWSRKWSSTLKSVFDALLYSLVTAGTFGWLWPS